MPSSTTSLEQPFDLQTKENSQELHDKLANILERFEVTRKAIKDNVKMLENISDSTTAIGSSSATGNSTIDSSSSYPYSLNIHNRSLSSTRLGAMDMGSGTGTSYGLRTISSVDSGVMLTLTSCSEAGTRSRSRSLGSWHGATSPVFVLPEDDRSAELSRLDISEEIDSEGGMQHSTHNSNCDGELDVNRSLESLHCTDGEDVFATPGVHSDDEEYIESESDHNLDDTNCPYQQEQCDCCSPQSLEREIDGADARFETQEHSFSFEGEDADSTYHVLSRTPSSTHQSPAFSSRAHSSSIILHAADGDLSDSTKHLSNLSTREPRTCIVLPAIERVRGHNRRPTTLNIPSHLNDSDNWMDRDHFSIQDNSENHRFSSSSTDNTSQLLEKFQPGDSRLIFSPIPEESPSDLTPNSPNRRKKVQKKSPLSLQMNPDALYTNRPEVMYTNRPEVMYTSRPEVMYSSRSDEQPHSSAGQKLGQLIKTVAQVHHQHPAPPSGCYLHSLQSGACESHDHGNKKSKKYRRKRKKLPANQQYQFSPANHNQTHCPLASTTSSASSIQSSTPKSDIISMSSYRNAIDKHGIALPQIEETRLSRPSHESNSSSSSPTYYDLVATSSSSSSNDGFSDTEYDYQVSLHNQSQSHAGRLRINHRKNTQSFSHTKPNPPVVRKFSKESPESKYKPISPSTQQSQQKPRLFKKNSVSPKIGSARQKMMKMKSDEASHSLLRYFRFPSPPRTTEDNSDSSHKPTALEGELSDGSRRSHIKSSKGRLPTRLRDEQPIASRSRGPKGTATKVPSGSSLHLACSREMQIAAENSVCSCATSSTTDTASEIAYPDLKPQSCPSLHKNSAAERIQNAKQPLSIVADIADENIPPQHTSQHLRQNPDQSIAQRTDIDNTRVRSGAAHSIPTSNYTFQDPDIQETNHSGCSIFSILFRKQKKSKENQPRQTQKLDPKLTLDLAGGEVRVRSRETGTSHSTGGLSYLVVPPPDQNYSSPKYSDYSSEIPSNHQLSSYNPYTHHHPQAPTYHSQPLFVVPGTADQPVNYQNQRRYVVEEYPGNLRYIGHRPRKLVPVTSPSYLYHPMDHSASSYYAAGGYLYPSNAHHPNRADSIGYLQGSHPGQMSRPWVHGAVKSPYWIGPSVPGGTTRHPRGAYQQPFSAMTHQKKHYQIL